jgi:hypothetical protein
MFDRFMRMKKNTITPVIPSFVCKKIWPLKWVPEGRENAVLIALDDSNDMLIFGGIGTEPITRLTKFEMLTNEQMEAHILLPN